MKRQQQNGCKKRIMAFLIDSFLYCGRIAIIIMLLYPTDSTHQLAILEAIIYSCVGTIIAGTLLLLEFIQIVNSNYVEIMRESVIRSASMIIIITLLRSLFITYYEFKNDGYSKGGKEEGIRVIVLKQKHIFLKLYIRNLVLFTGGMTLFFLPCIPIFDKKRTSIIDKLLGIRVEIVDKQIEKVSQPRNSILKKEIHLWKRKKI